MSRHLGFYIRALLLLAVSASLVIPHPARGDELSSLFRTPMADALFESRAGRTLMRDVLGLPPRGMTPDYDAFLRRLEGSDAIARQARLELERTLDDSQGLLEDFRAAKSPERIPLGPEAPLTREEQRFLHQLAERRLLVNPAFDEVEFIAPRPRGESARERFLLAEPKSHAAPAQEATAWRKARDFISEMNACVRNQPAQAARRDRLRYIFTQMGISASLTTVGFVTASCSRVIDWKNLSSDLLMSVASSAISSQIMTGKTKFLVRLMRIMAYGEARSAVDAVYYYITPLKDTHGVDVAELVKDRFLFSTAWNATQPLISTSLYSLVSGLECLYPGARTVATTTGLRLLQSTASSILFFRLRNHATGRDELADCN